MSRIGPPYPGKQQLPTSIARNTAKSSPNASLPPLLTRFVGRKRERDVIGELLLDRHDVHLVSLTGPGGVGKTRLALEVTRETATAYADGAMFVPLAPVRDSDLVLPTVAQAFGVRITSGRSPVDQLAAYLQGKVLLLILDNVEHILDASPLFAELLTACPGLTILTTSREVLHLSGEHTVRVPPLALPNPERLSPVERLTDYDGIDLFVDRARATDASFVLTVANALTVAQICQRLDGLPLAIELAAARIGHLPLEAILARLEHRLPLLRGGPRDQPDRLRTMRDAIAWSYDLLDPGEQWLFRRLSVFVGGFTLEAAEAVLNDSADAAVDVLEGVASLVDKSLVQQMAVATGTEPSFGMLETIREFAREHLVAHGEEELVRRSHAAYMLALAEAADDGLLLPEPVHSEWRDRLASERDNLRAALNTLAERGEDDPMLRLTGALGHFWFLFSDFQEGLGWYAHALAHDTQSADASRAIALRWAGLLAMYQLEIAQATRYLDESLDLFEDMGDPYGIAFALVGCGMLSLHEGAYARAIELHERALALLRDYRDEASGPSFLATVCFHNLGAAAYGHGDDDRAVQFFEEAITRAKELGYSSLLLLPLIGRGNVARDKGDWEQARHLYQEALSRSWTRGNKRITAYALAGLGAVAEAQGCVEQAARLFGAAEGLHERIGVPLLPAFRARHERVVATVRERMGAEGFAAARASGRALALELMVAGANAMGDFPPEERPGGAGSFESVLPGSLTRREVEVLRLLAAGHSNREIAEALCISQRTAAGHVANILGKLGLPSRAAAAAFAVRHGHA